MLLLYGPVGALLGLLALIPALVGHEFAHGYSAHLMGDPTPKMQGRLTLNPMAHLDPIGTLMIIFAPFGWAKPVQVNPYNFADPAKGMAISTFCGPLSNIVQGVFWGLILRVFIMIRLPARADILLAYLGLLVSINFVLAVFNLIPIGPLDGHHLMEYFLPYPANEKYTRFNNQYGMMLLFGLILVSNFAGLPILQVLLLPARLLGYLVVGASPWAIFARFM